MDQRANAFFFGAHGAHEAWTQGVDVAHIVWRGDVSAEDVAAGAAAFELVPQQKQGFFLVLHVAEEGQMSSAARKAITSDPRSSLVREVIVVGANFHTRVVLGMISKALAVLGTGQAPMTLVATEEEVEPLLERLRRKWASR